MKCILFILIFLSFFYLNGQNKFAIDKNYLVEVEACLKKNDFKTLYKYTLSVRSEHNKVYSTNTLTYNELFSALSKANVEKPINAIKTLDSLSNIVSMNILNEKIFFLIKGIRGIVNYRQGDFLKCSNSLTIAIDYLTKIQSKNIFDDYLLANFYRYLGRSYSETGIYLQAISVLQKSSEMFLSMGNIENTFINDKYIGRVYLQSSNITNTLNGIAIKKFKKALHGFKIYKMQDEIPWIYTIIADYYIKKGYTKLAKKYQDSVFYLLEEDNLLKGLAFNNYGEIFEIDKKPLKAREYYYKAINVYKNIRNYSNRAVTYYNLSNVFLKESNLFKSQLYADSSLTYSQKTQNYDKVSKTYIQFSEIYKLNSNFKKAYYYLLKSSNLSDSLNQKQNVIIAHSYNALYQSKEKEKENQKLQFQNKLSKDENVKIKSRNIFITSSFFFIIIIILFVFIIIRKNQNSKFNKLMLKEIDEQNDIIAKNLHDGMSGYLHSVRDSLLHKNGNTESLDNEINIIKRSQKELRFLMKQLNSPFYKNKNFNLFEELTDLHNFYENTSNFKISNYFDDGIDWNNIKYENKLQLYKLVQELLANVKKHSEASEVSLQIIKDKKHLILSIEDNGKGFDTDLAYRGYGLKNMEKRIKEMKGEMKIDSNIGEGAFFSLRLPVLN